MKIGDRIESSYLKGYFKVYDIKRGYRDGKDTGNILLLKKAFTGAMKFSFSAEKDGFLWLAFGGGWASTPEMRTFIVVDGIKFNGQEAPNGGFETLKPDLSAPRIWNLGSKSKACLVKDAKEGKKAMKINHDNRIGQGLKVEAGKRYTISLFAKAAK